MSKKILKFFFKYMLIIHILLMLILIYSLETKNIILIVIFGPVLILLTISPLFNNLIKTTEPCEYAGWHLKPKKHNMLNNFQPIGLCPRCGKEVLLDSQGNWF